MDIKKLNEKEKYNLLNNLLNDLKPIFKITGEAINGGKYSEFIIKDLKLENNFNNKNYFEGLNCLTAKIGFEDICLIKYKNS